MTAACRLNIDKQQSQTPGRYFIISLEVYIIFEDRFEKLWGPEIHHVNAEKDKNE